MGESDHIRRGGFNTSLTWFQTRCLDPKNQRIFQQTRPQEADEEDSRTFPLRHAPPRRQRLGPRPGYFFRWDIGTLGAVWNPLVVCYGSHGQFS